MIEAHDELSREWGEGKVKTQNMLYPAGARKTMSTQRPAFWLVWNPQREAPTHQHENKRSAEIEAERLARANRGQRFIVLQSIGERVVDDVQRIEHVGDDLPF
jgi:hypothetical protein